MGLPQQDPLRGHVAGHFHRPQRYEIDVVVLYYSYEYNTADMKTTLVLANTWLGTSTDLKFVGVGARSNIHLKSITVLL